MISLGEDSNGEEEGFTQSNPLHSRPGSLSSLPPPIRRIESSSSFSAPPPPLPLPPPPTSTPSNQPRLSLPRVFAPLRPIEEDENVNETDVSPPPPLQMTRRKLPTLLQTRENSWISRSKRQSALEEDIDLGIEALTDDERRAKIKVRRSRRGEKAGGLERGG